MRSLLYKILSSSSKKAIMIKLKISCKQLSRRINRLLRIFVRIGVRSIIGYRREQIFCRRYRMMYRRKGPKRLYGTWVSNQARRIFYSSMMIGGWVQLSNTLRPGSPIGKLDPSLGKPKVLLTKNKRFKTLPSFTVRKFQRWVTRLRWELTTRCTRASVLLSQELVKMVKSWWQFPRTTNQTFKIVETELAQNLEALKV